MANFIYSFDIGLYDTHNGAAAGYPFGSGPVPIENSYLKKRDGDVFAKSGAKAFTHSIKSPLSDANGGIEFLTGGRLKDGATIIGCLYNFRDTATGNSSVAITAAPTYYHIFQLPEPFASGWHYPIIRISSGYHGDKIALVTDDNRTILYTINHRGATHSHTVAMTPDRIPGAAGTKRADGSAGMSGFNIAVGPNLRRKVALGYA